MDPLVSIVILTYQRPKEILRNVTEILSIEYYPLEVIVVNNGDAGDLRELPIEDARLTVIDLDSNIGVGGRNVGIRNSRGQYIITLDDDVFGLSTNDIQSIIKKFQGAENLCAINFKVIDDITEQQVNWMHHKKIEDFSDIEFQTYEISEGAVAFRRDLILETGLYPESFFISHEGPDLALQIMKIGAKVIYYPEIVVRHSHAEGGRPNWRPYYYDTRNQIFLAVRHYPMSMMLRKLSIGLGAMLIYSLRDGFFRFFLKGCVDGIRGFKKEAIAREVLAKDVLSHYIEIEKDNPSLFYMLRKRLFSRNVKI